MRTPAIANTQAGLAQAMQKQRFRSYLLIQHGARIVGTAGKLAYCPVAVYLRALGVWEEAHVQPWDYDGWVKVWKERDNEETSRLCELPKWAMEFSRAVDQSREPGETITAKECVKIINTL